jgi:signal transduction histidine kinase/ligand-binding sensor domain-containing protein
MVPSVLRVTSAAPARFRRIGGRILPVALCALALTVPVTRARATDLRRVLTDYTLESWSQKDGLPDASVYVLTQDADGYIWAGTQAGPYRFDGVRFTSWRALTNTAANARPARALFGSADGRVWIGFGGAGGIAVFSRGRVREYGEADGLPRAAVSIILEDADGAQWAGTASGLFRLEGDRWHRMGSAEGVPEGSIGAGYRTRDGRLVFTAGRIVIQYDRHVHRFHAVAVLHDDPRALGEDPLGALIVTDQEDGFRRVDQSAPRLVQEERGRGRAIFRDRRNNIWVGTAGQGLWRVKFDKAGAVLFTERATALTGLLADGVVAVTEDREGNIWAATPEGINRLTPHKVAQVTNIGLVAGVEHADPNALWVGTVDELLRMPLTGDRAPSEHHRLADARLRALHADAEGRLWVATNHGISRYRDGHLEPLPVTPPASMPHLVDSITSDGRGGIWAFDSERGLLHWRDGAFTPLVLPTSLASARVEATLTDNAGRAWFTFSNGSVALSADDTFSVFGAADGADGGVYQAIFEDAAGNVWLGGTNGLTRYDGRFVTTRSDRGFPVGNVTAIVDDGRGTLWIGSGSGILQIRRDEWERLLADPSYQPQFRVYDRADGLAGLPYVYSRNRRAIRSDDGRLWFVTGRGLTVIDPSELETDEPEHSVRIEGVLVNGLRTPIEAGRSLSLPSGVNRLELEYTAINLTSPLRQHFRYKLEGFDSEWIEAGTRRQAFYTNLPPRSYRFRVMTADADGAWTESEAAALTFSIRPMFYQTTWFWASCALAIALVVGGSWRLHVRQVRQHFAMLIGERARLSRELHDTLLQSLVGIALQFDALANDPEFTSSDSQRREFVRMRRRVEGYIREARQSIADLRSPRLDTQDLATALREAGEREVDGRAIELSFHQHGTPRAYPAGLEEQLLKIGREAIVNAARHAQADHISVELDSSDDTLTLRVTDNGTGFDPHGTSPDGAPHYGLTSMRERAEDIGARFTIESAYGRGTRVEAVVPLDHATRGKRHVEPALH